MRFSSGFLPMVFVSLLYGCSAVDQHAAMSSSFEDQSLENQAISRINARHIAGAHANVTCFNRHLLLTGEVPNESIRSEIAQIALSIQNVQGISNELVIGEVHGIASSSTDSLISSNVKMRIAKHSSLGIGNIKVITVNGSVFLMGLMTRKDADVAASIASTTKDVQRVVKVFEYLD